MKYLELLSTAVTKTKLNGDRMGWERYESADIYKNDVYTEGEIPYGCRLKLKGTL